MIVTSQVAILITCYNKAKNIGEAIRSALCNGSPVIVVDDCSTDASWEIICEFQGITRHRASQNGGASSATLKALEIAERDGFQWVAFLDGDDVIAPNATAYFSKVLSDTGVYAIYSTPDRSENEDRRLAVVPVADADHRVLVKPLSEWLQKPRASTALCGKIDVIKEDLDARARIQDHQIAFSIHRNCEAVIYSEARTHFYSIAKPGENLVLDGREGGRSAVIAYSLHWDKVQSHPKGYKYQKRAFSALTKLRKYDVFGRGFTIALFAVTPFKSLLPGAVRHGLLTYAAKLM
jgi:glycosyltransferase involved in cell wall biosynthesis